MQHTSCYDCSFYSFMVLKLRHSVAVSKMLLSSMALGGVLSLTACGGNDATTRTSTPINTTPTNTISMTAHSPVYMQNVMVKIIHGQTGAVLATQTLTGTDVKLGLNPLDIAQNTPLITEFLPVDNTSQYYDPALNRLAAFNQPLRAYSYASSAASVASTVRVDPYSEIAYRRALARNGIYSASMNLADLKQVNAQDIDTANGEVYSVFNVTKDDISYGIGAQSDINDSHYLGVDTYVNRGHLLGLGFTFGHVLQYYQNHANSQTPWLDFSNAAAQDLLDGDLDGMTMRGLGQSGSQLDILQDRLVPDAPIINSDGTRNTSNLLALDQAKVRTDYNQQIGAQMLNYFGNISGFAAERLAWLKTINTTNYTLPDGSGLANGFYHLHTAGAGNYTRAFGLDLPDNTHPLFKQALSADDTNINDIEQLVGLYKNAAGCQLGITTNGVITLTQQNVTSTVHVNREVGDNLSRPSAASHDYTLNVSDLDASGLPRFIQIRLNGSQVLSATAGVSTQQVPMALDQVSLSCNF